MFGTAVNPLHDAQVTAGEGKVKGKGKKMKLQGDQQLQWAALVVSLINYEVEL